MKRRAPQDLPNYHRGTRQRLADAAAAIPLNQPRPSRVANMLLHDWSWGLMPATKVQKTCQGILEDNDDMGQATHPEVRKLASLGNSGQTPGNCNRDLACGKLKKPPVMTALTSFQVRLKTSALTHRDVQSKVLWPHQLFALLYKHHKDTFTQRILGGSSGNLPRFWEAMANNSSAYANNPVRFREDHMQRCVPISLHGDAVPVNNQGRTYAKQRLLFRVVLPHGQRSNLGL